VLHLSALDTTDPVARESIIAEIDSYLVPCAILKRNTTLQSAGSAAPSSSVDLACLCGDPSHAVQLRRTSALGTQAGPRLSLPIKCLFLLPQDAMVYYNLPDLGIFIRATMTKKFFTSLVVTHNRRVHNLFVSGSRKCTRRKKKVIEEISETHHHWTHVVCNSWCTSLLLETVPCLNRYKRGFKHSFNIESVNPYEVRAVIHVMYGCLLKLYNRGSKIPTFVARVNIISRSVLYPQPHLFKSGNAHLPWDCVKKTFHVLDTNNPYTISY
jgi:hypothetical protein